MIEINGVQWTRAPGARHKFNYEQIAKDILAQKYSEVDAYRTLFQDDLWALIYFVLKVPIANHPFFINACREVQDGPKDLTLDLWGREHGKSTIITVGETIQEILNDPESTHCILSYNRSIATAFLKTIKQTFETSEILKELFPEILYDNPEQQSSAWGAESGLLVKRQGNPKEMTVEAWGLEAQPTSKHFLRRKYDDIITYESSQNPEQQNKTLENLRMSHNLGKDGGSHRVIGTPYHHGDAINAVRAMKNPDGTPFYFHRLKPSLENGEPNGKPVFLSESRIHLLRQDLTTFYPQHLLDPTPKGSMKLDPSFLKEVEPHDIPKRLYKFMLVDGAGTAQRREDSWAILTVGVEPTLDDAGGCNLYIIDAFVEPTEEHKAIDKIVEMYKRAGRVERLGIEKVGMASTEVHVANGLRAAGRHVSVETGTLEILRPAGRKKEDRILKNLQWPLNNGKIHISRGIPAPYRKRLEMEMEKFPFATHDDFVDALSYAYDILADYRFPKRWVNLPESVERYERDYDENRRIGSERDWMTQ